MLELKGEYNKDCKVFADEVEEEAISTIYKILNERATKNASIRIMPDVHAGKGIVIGFTMPLTEYLTPEWVGVDIGCLDMETEFLSETGWKKISEFNKSDKVMQYNKNTDTGEFVIPYRYIVENCDYFYHFKNNKGLDQQLSEEHKLLIWKGYKKRGYNLQDFNPSQLVNLGNKLNNGYYGIKASFNISNKNGLNIPDDFIRLDIMISADGTIRKKTATTNRIELHFKKQRKIDRAKKLFKKCNISFAEYTNTDTTVSFVIYVPSYIDKSLHKYWRANKQQLKIVSEECLLWDGHLGYRGYYSSTNKENADVIQYAFTSNDIRAGIHISKSKNFNWNDVYIVTPTKNNIIGVTNTIERVKSKDGKKYCFTVESGYFVARRNNKTFITGNCGMLSSKLNKILDKKRDIVKFEKIIKDLIPMGFSVHSETKFDINELFKNANETGKIFTEKYNKTFNVNYSFEPFDEKYLKNKLQTIHMNVNLFYYSIGTLGGGNHFIEIGKDSNNNYWLTIHSGSRNFGLKIANYWAKVQKKPQFDQKKYNKELNKIRESTLNKKEIPEKIKELKEKYNLGINIKFLSGKNLFFYLRDMVFAQEYAKLNRLTMVRLIINELNALKILDSIESTHNYIDFNDFIIRKGAISSYKGKKMIIPLNMRDGILLCEGKSNKDWNFSAPHGAGRIMSRSKAKKTVDLETFKKTMKNAGVYSTSVNINTLDEAPFVYKKSKYIEKMIEPTAKIIDKIKPIINIKAD